MFKDLLDLASAGFWKLILMLVLVISCCGLYLWVSHQRQLDEQRAQRKRTQKRKAHRDNISRLRTYIDRRKRGFLCFRYKGKKRKFLVFEADAQFQGLVRPRGAHGVDYLFDRKRKKARFLVDLDGDGLGAKDLVGKVRLRHGNLGQHKLERFELLAYYPKRWAQQRHTQVYLAAIRAIDDDVAHLKRIQVLRRSQPFDFHYKTRRKKWKFWKKGKLHIHVEPKPADNSLELIYWRRKKPYGCKRNLLTPWKKKCAGIQETQKLFLDSGLPGLNPKEADFHGTRVLRDGKVHLKHEFYRFGKLPLETQAAVRYRYTQWVALASRQNPNKPAAPAITAQPTTARPAQVLPTRQAPPAPRGPAPRGPAPRGPAKKAAPSKKAPTAPTPVKKAPIPAKKAPSPQVAPAKKAPPAARPTKRPT